jgi:hypothetical protein
MERLMSINEKLFDRIVDHAGDVRLYENGVQKGNLTIITQHRNNLRDLLKGSIRADVKPEVTRFTKELQTHNSTSLSEFSNSQKVFHKNNLDSELKKFYRTQKPSTKELLAEITGPQI